MQTKIKPAVVGKNFFEIGEKLSLIWLLDQAKRFVPRQYFQLIALRLLVSQIQQIHMEITKLHISKNKTASKNEAGLLDNYNNFIEDIKSGDTVDAFVSFWACGRQRVIIETPQVFV